MAADWCTEFRAFLSGTDEPLAIPPEAFDVAHRREQETTPKSSVANIPTPFVVLKRPSEPVKEGGSFGPCAGGADGVQRGAFHQPIINPATIVSTVRLDGPPQQPIQGDLTGIAWPNQWQSAVSHSVYEQQLPEARLGLGHQDLQTTRHVYRQLLPRELVFLDIDPVFFSKASRLLRVKGRITD